jgi:hypothetical protein
MKPYYLLFLAYGISQLMNAQSSAAPVWITSPELTTCESVLKVAGKSLLYVSNISGTPTDKDGNGFISLLTADGAVQKLHWVDGLDAPQGMGLYGNRLFVTNIDEVVEIDVLKAAIVARYHIEGSKFLNDIAVDRNGDVYISDMQDNTIYCLKGGEVNKWLNDSQLTSVNGLCIVGDLLFAGVDKALLIISLKDRTITKWADTPCGIDGLESDGKGGFIYSDWQGHIYHQAQGREAVLLLDLTSQKMNAADITFDGQFIYVPTFFDNRVAAYRFSDLLKTN